MLDLDLVLLMLRQSSLHRCVSYLGFGFTSVLVLDLNLVLLALQTAKQAKATSRATLPARPTLEESTCQRDARVSTEPQKRHRGSGFRKLVLVFILRCLLLMLASLY